MMKKLVTPYLLLAASLFAKNTFAQVILNADGPGNTYELINSILAPGYDAVEQPECVHPSFGRHIAEVFDTDLNQYVFEFYSHVASDNDRCINFDRERVEIKTYDQSPANLKGTLGETVNYKWRFKIPTGFQPSSNFTHIHQVKPVNGDDSNPLFTITLRKGSPNKLEVNHYDATLPNNVSTKLVNVNMSSFENTWVEATETVKVGANGTYSMIIKRVSDNAILVNYSNNNIVTIRPNNDFVRPKWGIYRSLLSSADLRDDAIRFANISIQEGIVVPVSLSDFIANPKQKSVLLNWTTQSEKNNDHFIIEHSTDGKTFENIGQIKGNGTTLAIHTYHFEHTTPSVKINYYRLKQVDFDGSFTYSFIRAVDLDITKWVLKNTIVQDVVDIETEETEEITLTVFNTLGQAVLTQKGRGAQQINVSSLAIGTYIIKLSKGGEARFLKQ